MLICSSVSAADTILEASSLERCDVPEISAELGDSYFVVGSYKLNAEKEEVSHQVEAEEHDLSKDFTSKLPPERVGALSLFKVGRGNIIELADRVYCPAVLDIKCIPRRDEKFQRLVVAESSGSISIWHIIFKSNSQAKIAFESRLSDLSSDILHLSVDIKYSADGWRILASNSDGSLSHFVLANGSLTCLQMWKAHDYEAWTTCFDRAHNYKAYSGGDDSLFRGWDTRTLERPVWTDKSHSAGVTSITQVPNRDHYLITGSYDGRIRLFDQRALGKPTMTQTQDLGGGVWRLKWHPNCFSSTVSNARLAVGAMHSGCYVLDLSFEATQGGGVQSIQCTHSFRDHQSMAYGIDWCSGAEEQSSNLLASCSFYDHVVHCWQAPASLV